MTNFKTNLDSRRFKRWEIFEYALVFDDTDSVADAAIIVDLSLGGMQVRSRKLYSVGGKCRINIASNTDDSVEIEAEVRHCTPLDAEIFSTGFRFQPRTARERVALVNFIHGRFQEELEKLGI